MAIMKYPQKVVLGDITVRDGFQHEEKTISTPGQALGPWSNSSWPGSKDWKSPTWEAPGACPSLPTPTSCCRPSMAARLLKDKLKDVELTAVTIREKAAERAIRSPPRKAGARTASSSWSRPANPTTGATPAFLWKSTGRCAKNTSKRPTRTGSRSTVRSRPSGAAPSKGRPS